MEEKNVLYSLIWDKTFFWTNLFYYLFLPILLSLNFITHVNVPSNDSEGKTIQKLTRTLTSCESEYSLYS